MRYRKNELEKKPTTFLVCGIDHSSTSTSRVLSGNAPRQCLCLAFVEHCIPLHESPHSRYPELPAWDCCISMASSHWAFLIRNEVSGCKTADEEPAAALVPLDQSELVLWKGREGQCIPRQKNKWYYNRIWQQMWSTVCFAVAESVEEGTVCDISSQFSDPDEEVVF